MKTQDSLSTLSSGMLPAEKMSILTFRLAEQRYGLPVTAVTQIIEMVAITRLPQLPKGIQGAINVHGRIVPVLDLRLRFGLDCVPYHLFTPIILTEFDGRMLALVADAVDEVIICPLTAETFVVEAQQLPVHQTKYIGSVLEFEQAIIPIIDLNNILSQNEQNLLTHIGREFAQSQMVAGG